MTSPQQQFRVLVVDDEAALRKVIRASLAASGFVVEEAGNGKDAIGVMQHSPFDLVLLDVNMPGMSGVEACRQIRAFAPRTGIVMVTVRDGEEDKVRALEAGADDYVTKPFPVSRIGGAAAGGAPPDSYERRQSSLKFWRPAVSKWISIDGSWLRLEKKFAFPRRSSICSPS